MHLLFLRFALPSLLLASSAAAQRIVGSSDETISSLRGFDACTGVPDGFSHSPSPASTGIRGVRVGPAGGVYAVDGISGGVAEIDGAGRHVRWVVTPWSGIAIPSTFALRASVIAWWLAGE